MLTIEEIAKQCFDAFQGDSVPAKNIALRRAYDALNRLKEESDRRAQTAIPGRFQYGLDDRLTKTKGSSWTGKVVGFYSTSLTPEGYCIESENERGSVQIYPVTALAPCQGPQE